jgi:hypothetical protein
LRWRLAEARHAQRGNHDHGGQHGRDVPANALHLSPPSGPPILPPDLNHEEHEGSKDVFFVPFVV